jgi:uncharacterized protein
VPHDAVRRQGAAPGKVNRYPGLKEELYLGDFEPDPSVLEPLGLGQPPSAPDGDRRILVVTRTPPSRALYHGFSNHLFERVLRAICSQDNVVCVALTRDSEQVAAIEALRLERCVLPRSAIDSRSLMYAADAMIGAGGTMTREAALMGIPTWTVFAGTAPGVDRWLERQGMLTRLTSVDQVARLTPRPAPPRTIAQLRERGRVIGDIVVQATLAAAHGDARGPRWRAPA